MELKSSVVSIGCIFALFACATSTDPEQSMEIRVNQESISPSLAAGQVQFAVPLTIVNPSNDTLRLNECGSVLQQLQGTEWHTVWVASCIQIGPPSPSGLVLPPNVATDASVQVRALIPPSTSHEWPAGTIAGAYRIRASIFGRGALLPSAETISQQFMLTELVH
jgi:hypothetical protein